MNLALRDDDLLELMDDPACDEVLLAATLRRFAVVNRLVSAWSGTYRSILRPWLAALDRPARVLDLGCGGGDIVSQLAKASDRDRLEVSWVGADPDPRAIAVARERSSRAVEFRCVDAAELAAAGEVFDVVLSNHVLHHLGGRLEEFVDLSLRLSDGLVLHGDIARGRLAYALYTVGITPLAPGTFLRTDGLRSIRRSFTVAELRDALARTPQGRWTVDAPAPFRLLAIADARG
jgi:2-polyprenyl-3-methyl-5-hydroxy-6-metoxy-1,4-benzoquinol methylase